mgnify:CR=1 FL=1
MMGFISVLLIVLCFSGCFGKMSLYTYDYENLKKEVVGVEILDIGMTGQHNNRLYVLKNSELEPFFMEFSQITFQKYVPPKSPSDHTFKLIYKDGSCALISAGGGGKLNMQGEFMEYAPCAYMEDSRREFYKLLSQYIELTEEDLRNAHLSKEDLKN